VVPQNLIRADATQRVAQTARGVADEFAVSAALIDLIKSDATLHEGEVFDPALLEMATPKLHAADFVSDEQPQNGYLALSSSQALGRLDALRASRLDLTGRTAD
jgi:response regulator RpfG family c-di-GMP phosphodiesterase